MTDAASPPASPEGAGPGDAPGDGDAGPGVIGNAAWLVVSEVVGKGASFALVVILARGLGATEYGWFVFAVSFVPLLLQLARWGLDLVVVRDLAADHGALSRVFANALVLRVALAGVAVAVAIGLVPLFVETSEAVRAVAIVAAALFLDELAEFVGNVFVAFERMRLNAAVLIVNRLASTAAAGAAVLAGGGVALAASGYLAGSFLAVVFAWTVLRRRFPAVDFGAVRRTEVVRLFRRGAPFGLAAFLNMGIFRVDAVIIQAMVGTVAVAHYGVAYRFFEPLLFLSWAVAELVLPRLVREHDRERVGTTFQLAVAVLLAFYLPIAAGAPFVLDRLLPALFSSEYGDAVPAAMWLTGAAAFYAVAHLARVASVAAGRRAELAWVAGGLLTLNVVLNVVLIPNYGFSGAAAATFFTELVEVVLLVGIYLRTGGRFRASGAVMAPVLASGAMAATLLVTGTRGFAALELGGAVYAATLLIGLRLLAPGSVRAARDLAASRKAAG